MAENITESKSPLTKILAYTQHVITYKCLEQLFFLDAKKQKSTEDKQLTVYMETVIIKPRRRNLEKINFFY